MNFRAVAEARLLQFLVPRARGVTNMAAEGELKIIGNCCIDHWLLCICFVLSCIS